MLVSFRLTDDDRNAIRNGVSCALLLERAGYALDKSESTRRDLKYRRGKGEVIIVNHEGKGWWDTGSERKGTVFDLLKFLEPGLTWRATCRELGALIGVEPAGLKYVRTLKPSDGRSVAECWRTTRQVRPGSRAWNYLANERCLPEAVIRCAAAQGILREGPRGAAWFAHHDSAGIVCGAELRAPGVHMCKANTTKTLFRYVPAAGLRINRMVVCEAAIDALSCSLLDLKLEERRSVYVSTAGGMGPHTVAAIQQWLGEVSQDPQAELVLAVDDDEAGDKYASRLAVLADQDDVRCYRIVPGGNAKDWNQAVQTIVTRHLQAS
ncbi:DUF3991 domain-containing protein [Gluconacetobacter azotocaptans]|uniref:DUF3991 domain-containing protein n=1 Tax=Gluconacetobacter azotocaptans TaxID=142834 RepID=A0A7W4JW55_9PROT|nr:DUF3991 and TOPRIM domain-containing protein [Gluconacetobacter azotocaptans]MBB2191995.1 DUF3991 domain-containing protein [Gluconacetobacter azotocaptans]GBQ34102.1 hypothetical protein AA13594_2802 [Gluconacetobacter azotocaptans DSM 13594]